MPFIDTNTFPQKITEVKTTKLIDIIRVLPWKLPWDINVVILGKYASFGIGIGNLQFAKDGWDEPTREMKEYFNDIAKKVGLQGTLLKNFKTNQYKKVRLYNEGRRIVDDNLIYLEAPTPSLDAPVLTSDEVIGLLPDEVPFDFDIYITGGIMANGWSANDLDLIVDDKKNCREVKKFFEKIIGWKVDVGTSVMEERSPVYRCLIYRNKCLQLP